MTGKKIGILLIAFGIMNMAVTFPLDLVSVSGIVNDKATGDAMEFVSIALINTSKKIVAVTSTDKKGEFLLDNIIVGAYTLKISFMGYAEQQIEIKAASSPQAIQLPPVFLVPENLKLDAVTISATKKLIEHDIDKTIINVSDLISAEGGNAVDILRKIPGITVDEDGNISLNGQPVTVLVDNRPTNLTGRDLLDLLYFMDGMEIDKVEIIQNPSAKYDATGSGGIINIRTKNRILKGLSGSLQATGGYYLKKDNKYNVNGGLTLNYRNKWLNTVLNANARTGDSYNISEQTIHQGNNRQYAYNNSEYKSSGQSVRLNNNFQLGGKDIIGLIVSGSRWNMDGGTTDDSRTELYFQDRLLLSMLNENESIRKVNNYSGNLNYQHTFKDYQHTLKESKHELLVNFDYMYYKTDPWSKNGSKYYDPAGNSWGDSVFTNTSNQKINILSAKADYQQPLWDDAQLEIGGKISQTTTDNAMLLEELGASGEWLVNDGWSNAFSYNERIGALYASVGAKFGKKWSAKAGLRWENTWSEGNWQKEHRDTITKKNYNDFFPTVFLGYTHSMEHAFSLSYALRVQRPDYGTLNPFRNYASANMYTEGNPDLLPQYTHSFTFNYTHNKLSTGLIMQRSHQVIVQESAIILTTATDYLTAITWQNFGKTNFYGVTASLANIFVGTWWSFNVYAGGLYTESLAPDYERRGFYANGYMENTFYMGKTWRGEITVNAQTPLLYGYYTMSGRYSASAGIRKNLWDRKATLSLYIDDIFDSQRNHVVTDRNGQRLEMDNRWSSRQIRLSLSYRFRDMKIQRTADMEEGNRF